MQNICGFGPDAAFDIGVGLGGKNLVHDVLHPDPGAGHRVVQGIYHGALVFYFFQLVLELFYPVHFHA